MLVKGAPGPRAYLNSEGMINDIPQITMIIMTYTCFDLFTNVCPMILYQNTVFKAIPVMRIFNGWDKFYWILLTGHINQWSLLVKIMVWQIYEKRLPNRVIIQYFVVYFCEWVKRLNILNVFTVSSAKESMKANFQSSRMSTSSGL